MALPTRRGEEICRFSSTAELTIQPQSILGHLHFLVYYTALSMYSVGSLRQWFSGWLLRETKSMHTCDSFKWLLEDPQGIGDWEGDEWVGVRRGGS